MFCPSCGHNAVDAKFCPECGNDLALLVRPSVCSACGTEVGERTSARNAGRKWGQDEPRSSAPSRPAARRATGRATEREPNGCSPRAGTAEGRHT